MEDTSPQQPPRSAPRSHSRLPGQRPNGPSSGGLQLHDTVLESWGFDIVSGAIPAGTRQSCEALSGGWGVSRTVVREAARVLESKGLLKARRRVGLTVQPVQCWNALDISVIRWGLNGPGGPMFGTHLIALLAAVTAAAAGLSASYASPGDCATLTNAVAEISAAVRSADHPSLIAQVAVFHRTLLKASNNPLFFGLTRAIDEIELIAPGLLGTAVFGPAEISGHVAVVAAIRSGDDAAAEQAMLNLNRRTSSTTEDAPRVPAALRSGADGDPPPRPRLARLTVINRSGV